MFLQPKSRLALVFPIGAVVEPAEGFDLGYGPRIVFGHPAVDVVEESRLVPQGFDFDLAQLREMVGFERRVCIRKADRTNLSPGSQLLCYRAAGCRLKQRRGQNMRAIRVVAIPTEIADSVRTTMRAPVYGFPAHSELASDDAPCRHCLRTFAPGVDRRILFTYDRFAGVESLPQPGPVYIHAEDCPRYAGDAGFPEELRGSPRTLEAYARGRRLITQEHVADGRFEPVIEHLLAQPEVDYIQVNSTTAGCYTFRIEPASDGKDNGPACS